MPGHSLGKVENNFCRRLLLRYQNFSRCVGARYLMKQRRESVDKGNFRYLFRGIWGDGGRGDREWGEETLCVSPRLGIPESPRIRAG